MVWAVILPGWGGVCRTDRLLLQHQYKKTEGSYLIKVADFGFSLKMEGNGSSLLSLFKGGTPHTLAPEVPAFPARWMEE